MVQSFLKKRFTHLIFKMLLYLIRLFLFRLKIRSNLLLLLSYQHLEIIQRQLIIYFILKIKVINCFTSTSFNLTTALHPLDPLTTYSAYRLPPPQLLIQLIINHFFYNYQLKTTFISTLFALFIIVNNYLLTPHSLQSTPLSYYTVHT